VSVEQVGSLGASLIVSGGSLRLGLILLLRWWPLPDMPPAPPRGPAIDVFNFNSGRCQTCRQHPPRGPPSTSSTSVVAAAGHAATTPRGPAIDVFNFSGGRYRTCHQHPPGGTPSTFLSFDEGRSLTFSSGSSTPTPPGGPPSTFLSVDGGRSWITSSATFHGPVVDVS
jgi:hypothetical protein